MIYNADGVYYSENVNKVIPVTAARHKTGEGSAVSLANIAVHKKRIKSGLLRDLMRNRALYTLAIPGLIWYVVFCYLPMAGIIIAFTKYNVMDGIFGSPFVGLDNFKFLINSRDLFQITYNTLFLNVLFIAFGLISQLSIAILLNEISSRMFKRVSQALMLLPFFVSWVLVGAISRYILGTDMGFANTLLKTLGLKPVSWYTSPQYWPVILTIASVWKGVGYGSIIYLAAIVGVDQEIYESAQLDGCSRPQLIRQRGHLIPIRRQQSHQLCHNGIEIKRTIA